MQPATRWEQTCTTPPGGSWTGQIRRASIPSSVGDDVSEKITITDAAGAVTVHDSNGGPIATAANPAGTESMAYNSALDLTAYSDASGRTWTASYDARGNMLVRTAPAPLSYVDSWTYDASNNVTAHVDGRGVTTMYPYDSNGRLSSISSFDAAGKVLTSATNLGQTRRLVP